MGYYSAIKTVYILDNMYKLWRNYAKLQKPNTKGHILCNSTKIKYVE